MTHAYAESYLYDAMKNLGEAFDYAVNACHVDIDEFMELFISTGFSFSFGKGNPKVISGLSGTELAMEIFTKSNKITSFPKQEASYDYSPEYWCGYILAYYQWATGRTFKSIHDDISMKEILKLYPTLHEASEDKFVDTMNAISRKKDKQTNLQRQRKRCGYSQKELSDHAGVNLRTLQQYESKAKDINKAAVITVLSLANALGCQAEDLLEYSPFEND